MLLSYRYEAFKTKLLDYLEVETASLPPEKSLLGSSDLIESLFGKYKLFSTKSPLKHMGHLVLTLPLLTAKLTTELISTALETVSFAAVSDWYHSVFGISPAGIASSCFSGGDARHRICMNLSRENPPKVHTPGGAHPTRNYDEQLTAGGAVPHGRSPAGYERRH